MKNKKPEQGDLVMVHWQDAYSESAWFAPDEQVGLTAVRSVGFYNGIHEDETGAYLSLYVHDDLRHGNKGDLSSIPAKHIEKIRVVEKAQND